MADRNSLRGKARSTGESVAGTFGAAASKAKRAGKHVAKTTKRGAKQLSADVQDTQSMISGRRNAEVRVPVRGLYRSEVVAVGFRRAHWVPYSELSQVGFALCVPRCMI